MDIYSLIPEQVDDSYRLTGLEVLLRRLQIAHSEADEPTYAMIGKKIGMSASTVCRIFNAKKPPSWQKLRAVLRVLDIADEEINTVWRDLWRDAENTAKSIPVRLDANLAIPGAEHCEICGAWLADRKVHDELHYRLDQLEAIVQHLNAEL